MREEDPKKMIGDPSFYFKGFKHEKDRIEYAMKLNSGYDFTPIPKPHEFR